MEVLNIAGRRDACLSGMHARLPGGPQGVQQRITHLRAALRARAASWSYGFGLFLAAWLADFFLVCPILGTNRSGLSSLVRALSFGSRPVQLPSPALSLLWKIPGASYINKPARACIQGWHIPNGRCPETSARRQPENDFQMGCLGIQWITVLCMCCRNLPDLQKSKQKRQWT